MSSGSYAGRRVLVAGAGVSGVSVVRALRARGAEVLIAESAPTDAVRALEALGAVLLTNAALLPGGLDDVIVSPGWRPDHPLLLQAALADVEVYSEPELAWRLRGAAPWLAVTGTNGKTTTVTMLAAILRAAGLRTIAAGNIGHPLIEAVLEPEAYDVLAVELSSFQLHWSSRLAPEAGALLNLADDHLDWHGGFSEYAAAKRRIWRGAQTREDGVAIGNADDPAVASTLVGLAGRIVEVTLAVPARGQLGLVDGVLVDNAFAEAAAICPRDQLALFGDHNVANALAAAALARSHGVSHAAIADGLRGYRPEPHRHQQVTTLDGVTYIDDSKATNPHAALASLTAHESVVWIAGGQLKGVDVDELVATVAPRLAGAVLLGVDRAQIAAALRRHAPEVALREVASTDNSAMSQVVAHARALARQGDTVLLAPAAASLDMFPNYGARGDAFAAAVRAQGAPQ